MTVSPAPGARGSSRPAVIPVAHMFFDGFLRVYFGTTCRTSARARRRSLLRRLAVLCSAKQPHNVQALRERGDRRNKRRGTSKLAACWLARSALVAAPQTDEEAVQLPCETRWAKHTLSLGMYGIDIGGELPRSRSSAAMDRCARTHLLLLRSILGVVSTRAPRPRGLAGSGADALARAPPPAIGPPRTSSRPPLTRARAPRRYESSGHSLSVSVTQPSPPVKRA